MRVLAVSFMLATLSLTAGAARANDGMTLYHVSDATYGCAFLTLDRLSSP